MERNARDKYITVQNAVAPRMDKKTLLMSFNSFCLDCPNKNVTHTHTHTLYPSIHVLYIDKVKRLIDFFVMVDAQAVCPWRFIWDGNFGESCYYFHVPVTGKKGNIRSRKIFKYEN
jgi:hypothetical protein